MAKMTTWRFTVEGSGPFPLDMLRYDHCFPRTEVDANIAQEGRVRRSVTLLRAHAPMYWMPTEGRWESVGWKIISIERETD